MVSAVVAGWWTVSGFDLAWFSSLSFKHFRVFDFHGEFFLLTSFSLPFSELSMVGLALDMVHHPSVL